MKRIVFAAVSLMAFLCLAIFFIRFVDQKPSADMENGGQNEATSLFTNSMFGYSFKYASDTYMIITPKDGPFGDVVFTQSVFNSKEYNSYDQTHSATEPPPSLTIAVFRDPALQDAKTWIMNSPYSNFKLSTNGKLSSLVMGNNTWLSYQWDGLYTGDEYVYADSGYIYVLSNTWTNNNSKVKTDMEKLIASMTFMTPTLLAESAHGDIMLDSPKANTVVHSPLQLSGQARGSWYFEGSFPIEVLDATGFVIASGTAKAQGDWMTQNMVPFTAVAVFKQPAVLQTQGTLVLEKDNPSGQQEKDDSIEVPILFK